MKKVFEVSILDMELNKVTESVTYTSDRKSAESMDNMIDYICYNYEYNRDTIKVVKRDGIYGVEIGGLYRVQSKEIEISTKVWKQ